MRAANANEGAAHENEEEDVFGGCGHDPGGRQCGLRRVLPEFRDGYGRVVRCDEGVHRAHTVVPSKTGAFHAEDGTAGAFTRWGGYSKTFPPGGYTTTVDIYLDISPPYTADASDAVPQRHPVRLDVSSQHARLRSSTRLRLQRRLLHRHGRTGAGPRFVISASNNTGRGNSFPKNPGRDPFTINVGGLVHLRAPLPG